MKKVQHFELRKTKKERFIIMERTDKEGFGKYKIRGNKATEKEAMALIDSLKKAEGELIEVKE